MKRASVIVVVALMTVAAVAGLGRASAPSRIVFTADRAPSLSGEIYRLEPNGQLVDLTNSPFQDSGPVVSPDGKHVAFFSDRSGALSVWEAGLDGGRLIQIGPPLTPPLGSPGQYTWQSYDVDPLACPCDPRLAWQPHGDQLAMIANQALFVLAAGQKPLLVMVSTNHDNFLAPGWSPDGKVLLAWDSGVVKAFSASGSRLWSISGAWSPNPWPEHWSWSPHGLLALAIFRYVRRHLTARGLRVYDESGHLRFAVRGRVSGVSAWSPNGSRLAAVIDHRLEVLTAVGKRVASIRMNLPGPNARNPCRDVVWASSNRVVVGEFDRSGGFNPPRCRAMSIDLRTGTISSASRYWFRTRSADGKVAAIASQTGGRIAIGVASASGGAPNTYAHVPACRTSLRPSAVTSLQFAGRSRSLVYASYCPAPPTDLYSVAPDGSGLRRITTDAEVKDPALSPEGTKIAYSANDAIEIVDSTGRQVTLTTPNVCPALAGETFTTPDAWPSWSADGTTILFSREDCEFSESLYTIPVSGGTPHNLGINGDEPAWGPGRIAYVSGGIWTAKPDGTNATQVSTSGTDPAWSADGRLAFLTGNNNTTVVVGDTQTQLPFTEVTSLAWSPDDTRFVVIARITPTGPFDLYTVNTDGSNPSQLTQNYDALGASWR